MAVVDWRLVGDVNDDVRISFDNSSGTIPYIQLSGTNDIIEISNDGVSPFALLGQLADDQSPSLGGNLDVAGNNIVSSSSGNINLVPDGTGKVVVSSDIDLNGSALKIDSTNIDIEAPLVTIGGTATLSADDNKDRGFLFRYHTGVDPQTAFIGMDDSTGRFVFIPNSINTSDVISGSVGDIEASKLHISNISGFTLDGNLVGGSNEISGSNFNIDGGDIAFTTVINKSPTITINGDVSGSGTLSLLGDETITLDIQANTVGITELSSSMLVIESEGIATNDNDTTIPTSAAVKDYVDNNTFSEVQADTSPTLGGNLDVGAYQIVSSSSGDITLSPDGTGSVVINGPLQVDGTTTTVNSTTITVDDPILTLGGDTAPAADDNKDRGIEFRYHDGVSARIGFMGWDDSASGFTLLKDSTNTSEVFSGTAADLVVGSISLDTDLSLADGGTGASDASGARTNLGLVIGTDIHPYDATLTTISGLAVGDGNFIVADGSNWIVESGATARTSLGLGSIATQESNAISITGGSVTGITDITVADGGTGASDASTARTNLGLVIGTDVQEYDAGLSDIATLAVTDGNFIVGNGLNWVAESGATVRTSLGLGSIATQDSTSVSISGGSVIGITDLAIADGGTGASNAADARTNLGLVIGTDVQAYDATLTTIAGIAVTDGNFIVGNGTSWAAESGATARTSLGLGTISTQDFDSVSITGGAISGITDLAVADGGTGASDAATARTNLGLAIGSNVQAYDAGLADIAGLAVTDGNFIVGDGANWVVESGATVRSSLGLGSMALQNSAYVVITGGTINQLTELSVNGAVYLGDATNDSIYITGKVTSNLIFVDDTYDIGASGADRPRNLYLSGDCVVGGDATITGGSVTGITDLAVADGGTGASDAATARTNLGLAIGSNVQAYDAGLADIAGLAVTNGNFIVGNGSNWVVESGATVRSSLGLGSLATASTINNGNWSGTDLAVANGGTGASDAGTARTNLGLAIGSNVQAYDAGLADIAGLSVTDGNFIVGDGTNWVAESGATVRTSLGLGSLATASTINNGNWSGTDLAVANGGTGASDAGTARTNLGLAIGSNVQAYDAGLADIAGLAVTNGNFIVGNGSNWVAESGATVRTSLGLGSLATASTINNGNWSGTDLSVANGGTGASDAGTARTNLGLGSLATASTINNGNWSGTDLSVANGGTGASDAGTARTNLGLGSISTQASNSVSITGGTIAGLTSLGVIQTSPAYTLDVTGDIRATGDVISDSDMRHKEDINEIHDALDVVLALRGVYYKKQNKDSVGVIAQEVESVLPQVVHTADNQEQTKSVSYGNVVGVLIEAIKEQQKQIDALKQRLR